MSRATRFVILGLLALSASAATAPVTQAGALDIGADPAILSGHNELGKGLAIQFFLAKTDGQKAVAFCTTASFEGTVQQLPPRSSQNPSEATITATYGKAPTAELNECVSTLGGEAPIAMNGCKYTLTGAGQAANTFLVDIVACTAGKKIEIKTPKCTFDLGEQNGLSHATATNVAGGQEVTLQIKLSAIRVLQTGAGCPDGNNHESVASTMESNSFVKAFKDAGTTTVTKHGHQYQQGIRGEQVSLITT